MKYRARYHNGESRDFIAIHLAQAQKKAAGIGRSNGWKLVSLGRV